MSTSSCRWQASGKQAAKKRLPSRGEDNETAQRHRQHRTLTGEIAGSSTTREQQAANIAAKPGADYNRKRKCTCFCKASSHSQHEHSILRLPTSKKEIVCAHLVAASTTTTASAALSSQQSALVPTAALLSALDQHTSQSH